MATLPNYAPTAAASGLAGQPNDPFVGQQIDPANTYVSLIPATAPKDASGGYYTSHVKLSDLIAYIVNTAKGL